MNNFVPSPISMPKRGLDSLTETQGLIHGAEYNPEQWPVESWPEDIRLMQQAGINLATVGVFSWATLEPSEGARNFGWLDNALDLLHGANLRGFFRGADYFSFAKETDVVANDGYTDPSGPESHRLAHDLCPGLAGGEPWPLIESATSAVNWHEHNVAKEPGELRVDALSAIARGADGVCYFQFRQSSFGAARFPSAVVPLAGEHTRVFREVAELGRDLQSLRQLAGTPSKAKIAVLFDSDSWWAVESPDTPTNPLEVLKQIQACYAPLLRRGLAVEVVHPSADLGRFELVLAPSLFILGQQNAKALGTFVQDGGHLVVGPFSAVADENGHLVPGRFPGVLAELLGVDGEEWFPLASPLCVEFGRAVLAEQAEASSYASIWAEDLALREETAEAVALFGEGRLKGKPAVVRNRKGEVSGWYVGADLPAGALNLVLVAALESAGIASPLVAPLPEPGGSGQPRRPPVPA